MTGTRRTFDREFKINAVELSYKRENIRELVHELIKERLQNSPFVGSDETGCKVNGKLHWFWTWQSPKLTCIAHSAS